MGTETMLRREERADALLAWHLVAAAICGLLALVLGGGLIGQQSNPLAGQLAQSTQLMPVSGQVVRVESDPCAYRTGAIFGLGGTCASGMKFWIAGGPDPIVATARGAPYIQNATIPPGGFAMAMVIPRSLPSGSEAHALTIDGATIVAYGAVAPDQKSGDILALLFLCALPMLLFPVHLMMRQSARERARTRIAQTATWGQ